MVGQNIYNMLKKYGGVWITCDVTPKKFLQKQDEQNPTLNNNLNNVTSRNNLNDRFENEAHIRSFFGEIGFNNIEIHKFIEVKDELKSFGQNQMQKQLNLTDANYKNLVNGNYGIMTDGARKISASIYAEISKTKIGVVRNLMKQINTYYDWISYGVIALMILVGLVPVVIALKIAKMISGTFTTCPYCGKVFLSKKAKFKLLSFIKFW